jgi:hypothetical protein
MREVAGPPPSIHWREDFERLQPASEIVGFDEVLEMLSKLLVAFVIEALDGGFLDGSIHSLDLTVGPGVFRFGQPMIDIVPRAGEFESNGRVRLFRWLL